MHGRAKARIGERAARQHIAGRLGKDDLGAVNGGQANDARQIDGKTQRQQSEHGEARAAGEAVHRAVNGCPCVHASFPRCLDTYRQLG